MTCAGPRPVAHLVSAVPTLARPAICLALTLAALGVGACHRAAPSTIARAPSPAVAAAHPARPVAPEPSTPSRPPRRILTTTSSLVVLEPIRFVGATDALDPRSAATLDAVAAGFLVHADLALIEVRAYAADVPPQARPPLAAARAVRVVEALVARGVPRARLVPAGDATAPAANAAAPTELRILRRRGG